MADALTCPICLDRLSVPVQTNCGHAFCGMCLIRLVEQTGRDLCPIDRVPFRHASHSYALRALVHPDNLPPEARDVDRALEAFNARLGRRQGANILETIGEDVIRLRNAAGRGWREMLMVTLLICFGIAYTVSNVDLIPDSIPVIGVLDDLLLWLAILHFAGGFVLAVTR